MTNRDFVRTRHIRTDLRLLHLNQARDLRSIHVRGGSEPVGFELHGTTLDLHLKGSIDEEDPRVILLLDLVRELCGPTIG